MVSPVRSSVLIDGLSLPTCALIVTFLATTLRFFIGALLHLYDMAQDPLSWLIDFLVIFFECLIMIFMGGLCSVQANRQSHFGLISLLLMLLVVDVLWIVIIKWLFAIFAGVMRRKVRRRERKAPLVWLLVNTALIVLIVCPAFFLRGTDLYSSDFLLCCH
jgi:hypothetical protein